MKFKKIFLIMLLLSLILTICAVSANENMTSDVVTANDNAPDEIVSVDETTDKINSYENYEDLLSIENNENSALSANGLDGISMEVAGFSEYDDLGYEIEVWIKNLNYDKNAKYNLNLQLYDKNGKLVLNSTEKIQDVYGGYKSLFTVKVAGGNTYTAVLTASMKSSLGSFVSKPYSRDIYMETEMESLEEEVEGEYAELVKINAPAVTVKLKANKYLKVKVTYPGGSPVRHEYVTIKIWTGKKAKTYSLRTDSKGIVLLSTKKLSLGTHKVKIWMEDTDWFKGTKYTKIIVKKKVSTTKKTTAKKKSNVKTTTIKINRPNAYFATKKLTTGDKLQTVYSKGGQYSKGVYAEVTHGGGVEAKHTKLLKCKVWFKNSNGKVITKSSTKVQYSWIKIGLQKGYTPYKAQVWYKKI